MPNYTFRKPNDEEFTITLFMSELDEYKKENPDLVQVIASSHISYNGGFSNKSLPGDWKNILTKMKKAYRGSTIND